MTPPLTENLAEVLAMKPTLSTLTRFLLLIGILVVSFLLSVSPTLAVDLRQGLEELSNQLSRSIPEHRRITVAVTDFVDLQGRTSELGRYIAERLTTRLSQLPRFRVIERRRLSPILNELRFSISDLVDPAKAKQFGKLLGVEALVLGTISDLGSTIDVDARLIEIETSNILPGATVNISKDPDVARLMERRPETPAISASQPRQPPSGATSPTAVRYQDFSRFRVEVEGIQAGARGDVTAFLTYINKTQQDLFIGLNSPHNRTFVVDSAGNRYEFNGSSGLNNMQFYYGKSSESPLTIASGMRATASLSFWTGQRIGDAGKIFSFSSEQVLMKRDGVDSIGRPTYTIDTTHNIAIRNIEPR